MTNSKNILAVSLLIAATIAASPVYAKEEACEATGRQSSVAYTHPKSDMQWWLTQGQGVGDMTVDDVIAHANSKREDYDINLLLDHKPLIQQVINWTNGKEVEASALINADERLRYLRTTTSWGKDYQASTIAHGVKALVQRASRSK